MNDVTLIKAILIILNVIIGILVLSLRSYFSTKTKNLATKEDIRDISLEEYRGKLEAQATKATMAAITKADTNLEQLSLEIALEGVKKKDNFNASTFIENTFKIWSSLIQELDENVVLFSKQIQDEVALLREQWPHIMGGSDTIKWVPKVLVSVFMKRAAINVFRQRMFLGLNSANTWEFDSKKAKVEYHIDKLVEQVPGMRSMVLVNMMGYGVKEEDIKEMFPGTKTGTTKSKPVK